MKSSSYLLVIVQLVCFPIAPRLWGESRTRLSFFKLPVSEVGIVRAELVDPANARNPETIDAVTKRLELTVLAQFDQADPWCAEPLNLEKSMGGIQSGGEELALGVKLKIEGSGNLEVANNAEVTLPTGGKGARFFQVIGGTAIRQPGAWHERCCWSDGKDCLMLWEYPVLEEDSGEAVAQRSSTLQVEMRWFQASEADITKLGASKPETREKALQWLAGRAKLWREAGYGFKMGNPSVWQMTQGKHDPERGESISDESFTIQTKCQEEEGKLKMVWTTSVGKKGEEKSTSLNAEMTSGVWEFLPVQGNPDANVIACRVTKL